MSYFDPRFDLTENDLDFLEGSGKGTPLFAPIPTDGPQDPETKSVSLEDARAPLGAHTSSVEPPASCDAAGATKTKAPPVGEFHLLGPPGCGKTYALTQRWIPRAVERFGADAVAVCSLTRAASVEIAARQRVPLHRDRVATLHSLAKKALTAALGQAPLAQTPENLELWNQHVRQGPLAYELQLGEKHEAPGPRGRWGAPTGLSGDQSMAEIEMLRHRMVPEGKWPDSVMLFWREWRSWKYENELHDYTDWIEKAFERGFDPPECKGTPMRALIVDEAQDLSRLEMSLVRQWGAEMELFALAGDPNQSIYGFRGAEATEFHTQDFPAERTEVLGQSYRLPKDVQLRAEEFLCRSHSRVPLQYLPKQAESKASGVFSSTLSMDPRTVHDLVDLIEREVALLEDEKAEDDRRVSVLTRNAYMLSGVLGELRRRGILFYNPFQRERGDWNPLRTSQRHVLGLMWGARPDLRDAASEETGSALGDVRLWTWRELKDWTEVVAQAGLLRRGAKANLIAKSAKERPQDVVDASDLDRIFTDAPMIRRELLPMIADPTRELETIQWLARRLSAGAAKKTAFVIRVATCSGIVALCSTPRVIVGTLHSIKGATSGSVILAPDLTRKQLVELKGPGHDQTINLFYVGMTRASVRLHLLSPQMRRHTRQPHVEW